MPKGPLELWSSLLHYALAHIMVGITTACFYFSGHGSQGAVMLLIPSPSVSYLALMCASSLTAMRLGPAHPQWVRAAIPGDDAGPCVVKGAAADCTGVPSAHQQ